MALKGWFRGGAGKEGPQEYSVDDLIVMERYDDAVERLRAKLKTNPNDLHSHLKLAEVYTQQKQHDKAVAEYAFVAEEYVQDGFFDKGIALLARAMKLAPLDEKLRFKVEGFQRQKSMEHVREHALEGLRHAGAQSGTSTLELQRLWHKLAGGNLVQHLPGDQLKRLFSAMEFFRAEPGTPLAAQGSQDAFLLLIVTGVVEASVQLDGRATMLRTFTSGDILGEGVLLERGAWPADYRATEPVIALKLTREGLEKSLVGNPDPRGFLEALREQHTDRDVASLLRRLQGVN